MYLRTPKRYRPGRRRHLRFFSRRSVLMLLVTVALGTLGWLVWEHRHNVRSAVLPEIEGFAEVVQTQVAPKPTPTATPDVVEAQAGCVNYYRQGNLIQAIEQCTILAETSPNDVELHYRIAHMLIITSNFGSDIQQLRRALEFAERTINAAPELPHGWAIRAMALDWMGEYGKALASALHAKALDPDFGPTYAFLAEVYYDMGQTDLALTYVDQALELDTSGLAVADAFRTRGLILTSIPGRRDEAIENYQAALQQAPQHAYLSVELAINYLALEDYETAISVLASALENNPTDPTVLFELARAHIRSGNRERAYEYYQRCLESDPDNVPCLSWLGGLQLSDSNYVLAITNLERAIELGSTDPDDFLELGRAHAAQGRCDLGIPYLQQGYQLVTESQNYQRQASFANALQTCGVQITGPATPQAAEAGDVGEAVSGEAGETVPGAETEPEATPVQ